MIATAKDGPWAMFWFLKFLLVIFGYLATERKVIILKLAKYCKVLKVKEMKVKSVNGLKTYELWVDGVEYI